MLSRFVNRLEEGLIAFFLAVMVVITFSQVVARYIFNTGAVWALELTTYVFAWLVLIGVSYGVKHSAHLGVDAFVRLFPARYQRWLILLAALLCCVYAGIMLYGSWDYWSRMFRFGIDTEDLYVPRVILEALGGPDYEHEPVGIDRWVPYLALPLGMALLLFRFVQAAVLIATGKQANLIASHEAEEAVAEAHAAVTSQEPRGRS